MAGKDGVGQKTNKGIKRERGSTEEEEKETSIMVSVKDPKTVR